MTEQVAGSFNVRIPDPDPEFQDLWKVPHDLIMIDLETLDTVATAKLLQIGAVNIMKPHQTFVATINRASQQDYFTTESTDTWDFWYMQPEDLRNQMLSGEWHIQDALRRLATWLPKNALVFGFGSVMDIAILEYHYTANDLVIPWGHRNVRCFRTIYAQAKKKMPNLEKAKPLIEHNALEDAIAQAITFRSIFDRFPEIAY